MNESGSTCVVLIEAAISAPIATHSGATDLEYAFGAQRTSGDH